MKLTFWLLLAVLCSVTLVQAQSSGKMMEMNGMACHSTCVSPVNNVATCDPTCTDKGGNVVFVDDQGNVTKIANPEMVKGHMGKHMRIMAVPSESEREKDLIIKERYMDQGGG